MWSDQRSQKSLNSQGRKAPLERIWSSSPAWSRLCPATVWGSPVMEVPQPLWTACFMLFTIPTVFFFSYSNLEPPVFQSVPTASRPVTEHYWEEHISVFSTQEFAHLDKISLSLLFSKQNSASSLSLSWYERCSKPLTTFVALRQACSSMSPSLSYCGTHPWTQHSRWVSPLLSTGEGSPPSNRWQHFAQYTQGAAGCFCHKCARVEFKDKIKLAQGRWRKPFPSIS